MWATLRAELPRGEKLVQRLYAAIDKRLQAHCQTMRAVTEDRLRKPSG